MDEFESIKTDDLNRKYETAANLAVFPTNSQEDVDRVCKRFELDKNYMFEFVNDDGDDEVRKHPFPTPCTVGDALTKYCELKGPLDRNIFKHLSEFATDDAERTELLRLSSNEAKGDLELMKARFSGVLDVFEQFKSIRMTGAVLLQLLPKMMPRYYTIASSSKLSPDKVRIAISLTTYPIEGGSKFVGLTSGYFDRVFHSSFKEESKEEVYSRIFIKDSLFNFPEDPKTPLIMIGPGTGVVPFIAFAEEREYLKKQNPSVELGEAHLYFGCKGKNDDYIYKDELAKFTKEGIISNLYEAFSRDQEKKVYVQDCLRKNKEKMRDLILNHNAHVYICGAMEMGHDVEKILENEIVQDNTLWKQIKDNKRFVKELWSA